MSVGWDTGPCAAKGPQQGKHPPALDTHLRVPESQGSWISFWSYSSLPGTIREALMLDGSLTFRQLGGNYLFTLENAGEIQACIKKLEKSPWGAFHGWKQRVAIFTWLFQRLIVSIYKAVKVILCYAQARKQTHLVLEMWDVLRCLKRSFQMSLVFSSI